MQRLTGRVRYILYAGLIIVATLLQLSSANAAKTPKSSYQLFVARFMDSDLIILDSATGRETGRIEFGFGANPSDLLLSPDLKTLYVSNRGHDEIAVVDVKSLRVKSKVKTGLHPHFMDFTPDGRYLIVVNNQDDKATILDASTLAVAGEPRIDDGASGIAVTGDGRFAYIPSIYQNNISVIDLEKMERVSTIKSLGPMSIVIPPGSNLAYFCSHRDRVSILDTRTNRVVGSIPAGDTPNHIRLSKDGRKLFVANALSNDLTVIGIEKREVLREIKTGVEPTSSALSPDGKFLFVANYGGGSNQGSISVIDVEMLEEVTRIKFRRYPRAVAVLPAE